MNTIGQRIAAARHQCGMSQSDLVRAMGAGSVKHLSTWENGRGNPSTHYIRKLALALGVSADYLLGLEDIS